MMIPPPAAGGVVEVLLTSALARMLTGAKSDQRARHSERDIANGSAALDTNLTGLVAEPGEEPLQAGTCCLGERLLRL